MNELKKADEVVKALRWLAKDTEFVFAAENLNDAADLIESMQSEVTKWKERHNQAALNFQQENRENAKLQAQLSASQRREKAAVDAIRKSLRVEKQQRPNLNRCHECAKRIVDSGKRKYKYGCESLCPDALKVIVGCGFDVYEPLIPFADEWRGPQTEKGEADGN